MAISFPDPLWTSEVVWDTTTYFYPLTTAFSYPDGCTNLFQKSDDDLVAFVIGLDSGTGSGVACLPEILTAFQAVEFPYRGPTLTSALGPFICPVNWQTMVTSTKDRTSTLALCCPHGYTLHDGASGIADTGQCQSTVTSGMTLNYVGVDTTMSWPQKTIITSLISTVTATSLVGWIHGDGVSRPLPTPNIPPATTSSTTQSRPIPSTNVSTSASPHAITNEQTAPSGLSTGAKAGIGVAVAVGVIGLIAFISALLIYRYRKLRFNPVNQISDEPKHEPGWKPELEAASRNELAGDRGAEMPAAQNPGVEMHAEGIPGVQRPSAKRSGVEMPGSDAQLAEMSG